MLIKTSRVYWIFNREIKGVIREVGQDHDGAEGFKIEWDDGLIAWMLADEVKECE